MVDVNTQMFIINNCLALCPLVCIRHRFGHGDHGGLLPAMKGLTLDVGAAASKHWVITRAVETNDDIHPGWIDPWQKWHPSCIVGHPGRSSTSIWDRTLSGSLGRRSNMKAAPELQGPSNLLRNLSGSFGAGHSKFGVVI